MNVHTSFREVDKSDITFVLNLYNYYIKNTTVTFHTEELSENEIHDLLFFSRGSFQSYIIEIENMDIGYCMLSQHKNRPAYDLTSELSIYILPEYTGKGIGAKALSFLEKTASKKGFHSLIATISGDNARSISLFKKHGYMQCAHYREVGFKFGTLLDVYAFQKIINNDNSSV